METEMVCVGVLAAGEVAGGREIGAARKSDQARHLPAVERHLGHRVPVDCLFEGRVLSLQLKSFGLNLDRLSAVPT
jgi:hypothetical protein